MRNLAGVLTMRKVETTVVARPAWPESRQPTEWSGNAPCRPEAVELARDFGYGIRAGWPVDEFTLRWGHLGMGRRYAWNMLLWPRYGFSTNRRPSTSNPACSATRVDVLSDDPRTAQHLRLDVPFLIDSGSGR